MSNQEILERAIQKAIAGGCNVSINESSTGKWIVFGNTHILLDGATPIELIFNHDFAKALWGSFNDGTAEGMPLLVFQEGGKKPALPDKWQYQLQQMVIADDPIKYLGENI